MPHCPTHRTPSRLAVALIAIAALTVLGGCGGGEPTPDPAPQATISALATSNAQLATQVAQLAQATTVPAAPTETAPVTDTTAAPAADSAAVSVTPAVAEVSLPQALIAVGLAPEGETLYDLRLDRASNHIFVTDSADRLHVVDATTYMPITTLPYGGWLELDSSHNRLYVYKPFVNEGEESLIHVLDTQSLAEVGTLDGRALAIDAERNRLFVGEPFGISTPEDAPGVRVVDGATLQETGRFTQTGAPVYNPLRDELLIVAYTVYTANPATGTVSGDLFPELTDLGENGLLWCNGCTWVDGAAYYPAEQLLAVDAGAHCAGKGCGTVAPPRFFDAATMQPIDPAAAPEVQVDCGSGGSLAGVIDGRRYVNRTYDRYVVYTNLLVTDAAGGLLSLRDGLRLEYANARTGQGYLYDGTVVDLATLAPVGRWAAACLFAEEPATGLLFGRRGGSLYVIAETGGRPSAPDPALPETPPAEWPIRQIAVSPDFAADNTLLAVSGAGIYRSTDGGQGWVRLEGGLPQGEGSNWVVAFSPGYAADRTIFAGGDRGEAWGEGVWRSGDGGRTWAAQWTDLQHRRIKEFHFAPDFAAGSAPDSAPAAAGNATLVAEASFFEVGTGQAGDSLQQSTDGGVRWTLVVTGNVAGEGAAEAPLPPVSELLPGGAAVGGSHAISAAISAGVPLREGEAQIALLSAPGEAAGPTLYALGNLSVWRSADNGATWEAWEDPRLGGMDYTNHMTAAAVSPPLADGSHRLFVGTADGRLWALDPAQMAWGGAVAAVPAGAADAAAAVQAPSPLTTTAAAEAPAIETPAGATPAAETGTLTETGALTETGGVTETAVEVGEPLAGEPPAGLFRPEGSTGLMWQSNARGQQALGWARTLNPTTTGGAYQQFERGTMVWRQDTSQIYVFFNDGTWRSFADTFAEGDRESDPAIRPPGGKLQPIRGFGKVWRENAEVREKLGWATGKEMAQPAEVHSFARGAILRYGSFLFFAAGVDTDRGTWF